MPSRQGHSKSRLGCKQCKARHIRCNQQYPQCGFCQRRNQSCSFAASYPVLLGGNLLPKVISGVTNNNEHTLAQRHSHTQRQILPLKELELFHHFTSVVTLTLGEYLPLQDMWRNDIPRVALKHEFLMCTILALSALHIYSTKDGQRENHEYREDALHYYDLASTQFRSVLDVAHEDTSDALFISSALLSIFVLGSRIYIHSGDGSICLDDVSAFHNLGKGIRVMAEGCRPLPHVGRIDPLLRPNPWNDVEIPSDIQHKLSTLMEYVESSTDNEDRRKIYRMAIRALKEPFQALLVNPGRPTLPFYFYIIIDGDFVALIDQRDPIALVILAYHAVLLDNYKQYWWCGNRGRRLVEEISSILGPDYQKPLVWPSTLLEN